VGGGSAPAAASTLVDFDDGGLHVLSPLGAPDGDDDVPFIKRTEDPMLASVLLSTLGMVVSAPAGGVGGLLPRVTPPL
jgi:hypothetical protein